MIKKVLLIGIPVVVVAGIIFMFARNGSASKQDVLKTVPVKKGTIIDKALAVGRIEPKREIAVKSKISGIVKKRYVEIGDVVKVGDPLIDVAPDPTPIEYAEAKRQVELDQVAYDNVKREFDRTQSLRDKQLISFQEFDAKRAENDEAELRLKLSKEKLALIESGRTEVADRRVDNIIKSPINGMVLSKQVEEGDPVVPLTSYQAGTDLMTLAYMDDLVFKGNVDEIDVGKLKEGMPVTIDIGAMPNEKIAGTLYKISPKAHKEEGSTLFEVEIRIADTGKKLLRAGYSANANIIINQKDSVLVAPERLLKMSDTLTTCEVKDTLGVITTRTIKTGLSDGINIEIDSGLTEGELLVERPPKEITASSPFD
ncbi:MAG TPA: efflux RND transporter periplasmic adaptor subunit [Candidatus Acidoferrum sp.]|nr:efflux RND transporter periplasmic adaptor subunit [Candidatus Acidoferrum sp.]